LFGYDWRQSLLITAQSLATGLSKRVDGADVSQMADSNRRFLFVTHSMGALLLRAAVGLNLVHHSWIERIVHIGAPLSGSPAAFGAAYDRTAWPFLGELFSKFTLPGSYELKRAMHAAARTFDTAYELLPQMRHPYISVADGDPFVNPLAIDGGLTVRQRTLASEAHDTFVRAEHILAAAGTRIFSIYAEGRRTPITFRVQRRELDYDIVDVNHSREGDDAVPVYSATACSALTLSVDDVAHAFLCNNGRVANRLVSAV
jgi:hypothetical protein